MNDDNGAKTDRRQEVLRLRRSSDARTAATVAGSILASPNAIPSFGGALDHRVGQSVSPEMIIVIRWSRPAVVVASNT
jgi:hypothetical protein